jgi:hypothetical protein
MMVRKNIKIQRWAESQTMNFKISMMITVTMMINTQIKTTKIMHMKKTVVQNTCMKLILKFPAISKKKIRKTKDTETKTRRATRKTKTRRATRIRKTRNQKTRTALLRKISQPTLQLPQLQQHHQQIRLLQAPQAQQVISETFNYE